MKQASITLSPEKKRESNQNQQKRSEFDQMLYEVKQKLEEKLKVFKEQAQNSKVPIKDLQDLQTLALAYKKLLESKDFDLKDLEQLQNAEKELKTASLEQSKNQQDLQELRQKLAQVQHEQRVVEQDCQIEEMRRQILEKLKNLKENIIKQKQSLSEQGQQKATKDMSEQIDLLKRYLSQIDSLEKNAISNVRQDLSRKIKECDDEYAKTKQDLIQANLSKQTYIKKLQDQLENQKKQNDVLNQEKEVNSQKIVDLQGQLKQYQQQKSDLINQKEKELQQLYQEGGQVEMEREQLEERYIELTHELQLAQRELRQSQMVCNYIYQEKLSIEQFNKTNPQLNLLKQILEQIKNKTTQLSQESSMLKEDFERKKMRIEQDQILEVNTVNQKLIQKLAGEVDKLIKDKEQEIQKLKVKQLSLEQTKQKQEQQVNQEIVEKLKVDYVMKHDQYKQAYIEKSQLYEILGVQVKEISDNNAEFIEREIQHSKVQLETEIKRVTVENNEDQLRVIDDKLRKAKEIEDIYQKQFELYDKQIRELGGKLQDRQDDIQQLEEILEDKDTYIDQLRKEVDWQIEQRKKMEVVIPQKREEIKAEEPPKVKEGFAFPMKRISATEFLLGGKVVNAKFLNGKLLFRTGGGYIMFKDFLTKYAKKEVEELKVFAEQENLTLDEVMKRFEQHYIDEYIAFQNAGSTVLQKKSSQSQVMGQKNQLDKSNSRRI